MRITADIVRRVAEYATEISSGAFRGTQVGGDIGHGTRFIDLDKDTRIWIGRTGAREAASYYLGVVEAYNAARGGIIRDLPEDIARIRAELVINDRRKFVYRWIDTGHDDANSRMRR